MTDLIEWLRAQLDADERAARGLEHKLRWFWHDEDGWDHEVIVTQDELLAEIAAKRAVLDRYEAFAQPTRAHGAERELEAIRLQLRWIVRTLATAYAHRPGYLEEWRP